MTELRDYRVAREHEGDRFYKEGEIRKAVPSDVAHLVPRVLVPVDPSGAKAEQSALNNKAERAAPANKAARPRRSKASK